MAYLPRSDYWITLDVQFNSVVVNQQIADPGNDFNFLLGDIIVTRGAGNDFTLGIRVDPTNTGAGLRWFLVGPSSGDRNYGSVVVAATWYTVELHLVYDASTDTFNPELYINGTDQGLTTGQNDNSVTGDNYVYIGTDINNGVDGYQTQFRNMSIGTTRGGNDIWDGSSLASTLVPPFTGLIGAVGDTPTDSLSASGGVMTAVAGASAEPHGADYAYIDVRETYTPAGPRYIKHSV